MSRFNIKQIAKTILIFIVSYLLFAFLWIQIKDSFSQTVTLFSSKITGGIKNARLENIVKDKDIIHTYFSPLSEKSRMIFTVSVPTYFYTSNMPMTFAIMASLFLYIRRRARAYSEAFALLLLTHLLYGVSFESLQLTKAFMSKSIEQMNPLKVTFYQFFWGFTDYMFIRFGPFLIGVYIYLRFRRS